MEDTDLLGHNYDKQSLAVNSVSKIMSRKPTKNAQQAKKPLLINIHGNYIRGQRA